MPLFRDFQKSEAEIIISLPYRVGMFIACADNVRNTSRDDHREERALRGVLKALSRDADDHPFLSEVAAESLSHEKLWPAWRARKGLRGDIQEALRLIDARLSAETAARFRKALFHIGCTVAMAYGEQSDGHKSEALAVQLAARLADRFFNPLEKNPENISAAEKAALQKLQDALKG